MIVVVGGGIAGLAAAWALQRAGGEAVVLEATERAGGKIASIEIAGARVDAGPDSFLARRPEAVGLAKALGLGDELISPATGSAYLWTRGALHRIPEGQVLGVPARFGPLLRSGALSPIGKARALLDAVLPASSHDGDRSVGEIVRRRFGREVNARLADPLLGGINAGSTERLSTAASAPQVAAALPKHRSLARALRESTPPPSGAPVFHSLRGGVHRLVDRLVEDVEVIGGASVASLERSGSGWHVVTADGQSRHADGVVLATPAFVTADLLAAHAPDAAALLRSIDYASVVIVTIAVPRERLTLPPGSGFLVPRVDGRLMTASTWFTSKWPEVDAAGHHLLRMSAGKVGDDRAIEMDDDTLVSRLLAEMREALGADVRPDEVRVNRWPRSFPQYDVGHLALVERIEVAVRALRGIALAGAAYAGVGIPACIGSATRAAEQLLTGD